MSSSRDVFEVVDADVRGVSMKVFKHAPTSLRAVWEASGVYGDRTYLVFRDESVTYAETHQSVAALAHRLAADLAVRPGDRVAIAMRNYPEWPVAFWAASAVGAVVVPLNAWWTGGELAFALRDSGATVLVADDERLGRLDGLLGDTDVRTMIAVRATDTSGALVWNDIVNGADFALPEVAIDPDDDATIMYTSGTTGRPKGAVATHRNFATVLMNEAYRANARPLPDPNGPLPRVRTTLLTYPLFHAAGLHSFLLPFTASGGKIVLMYKWDADEAVDLVEREDVQMVGGVPTTLFELLERAAEQKRSLPSLRAVAAGATMVPPELVRRIDRQFSARSTPATGYGLTETSGTAINNFGSAYLDRPDSVGLPVSPVIELRIVNPEGNDVVRGEIGEVWLKGPTVVRGYLGLEDANRQAFTDGWFHTGDLGRQDEDGFLYIVDRLKDVIIRGGENVYAAEVEAVLYEHADVLEAAIVGVPHPTLGEEVAAVVRTRVGASLSEDGVRALIASRLAAFKVPARVWLTNDDLPRNATGKVLKRDLREKLAADR